MHRFGSRVLSYRDKGINVQVTVPGKWSAYAIAFIRHADMQCIFIRFGINRNRLYVHFLACPDNTHRNFSAVCYEDPGKHTVIPFRP